MIWLIIISILISIGDVLTSVPIGGNLDILDFGSRSQPYVNLVRQSHAWGNASSPWGPGATVDPTTGWPTSDFGVILSASAVDLGGTYLLYAKGNAQVSVFEAKTNATRHPRMGDMCITLLNAWYRYGFQTLNWFEAGANQVNKFGSWGLSEDMRQEKLVDTTTMFNATSPVAQLPRPSPKLKAIDQVRQSSIELDFGIPVPSSNINATNYMHHYVPFPTPDLRYLQPNSTFYYPLHILQSPIQLNVTVYVAGKSGLLEVSINNEHFVQVQTPQTANMTTFQATPVMQFNITQSMVPSIITLRLKNIQNGYSIRSSDVLS